MIFKKSFSGFFLSFGAYITLFSPFSLSFVFSFWANVWYFSRKKWLFLSGSIKTNWLKRGVDLVSKVVIVHPRNKFSKFAANEPCSNRNNGTIVSEEVTRTYTCPYQGHRTICFPKYLFLSLPKLASKINRSCEQIWSFSCRFKTKK